MNIKPTKGKLLIKVFSNEKQTKSGIWCIGKKSVPLKGEVTAVGSAPKDRKGRVLPWHYEIGDIVHFRRYTHKEWRRKEIETYLFLNYHSIMACERAGKVYACNEYIIVKLLFKEKIGSIIVPDNRKSITADFTGKVISANKWDLRENDEVYIVRIEGGGHEGFAIETGQGKLFAVKSKWVLARKE